MKNAIISRRGGGYVTVKFENYSPNVIPSGSTATALNVGRSIPGATTVKNYALFKEGKTAVDNYSSVVNT